MKRITGRLAERNGKWYAVINLYTAERKRKEKWCNLDLESKRGSKTEANHRLMEILSRYNQSDLYLLDCLSPAECEKRRLAAQTVDAYLTEWLEGYKYNLSVLTFNGYKAMVESLSLIHI